MVRRSVSRVNSFLVIFGNNNINAFGPAQLATRYQLVTSYRWTILTPSSSLSSSYLNMDQRSIAIPVWLSSRLLKNLIRSFKLLSPSPFLLIPYLYLIHHSYRTRRVQQNDPNHHPLFLSLSSHLSFRSNNPCLLFALFTRENSPADRQIRHNFFVTGVRHIYIEKERERDEKRERSFHGRKTGGGRGEEKESNSQIGGLSILETFRSLACLSAACRVVFLHFNFRPLSRPRITESRRRLGADGGGLAFVAVRPVVKLESQVQSRNLLLADGQSFSNSLYGGARPLRGSLELFDRSPLGIPTPLCCTPPPSLVSSPVIRWSSIEFRRRSFSLRL